jgi:ribose transport system permease protein
MGLCLMSGMIDLSVGSTAGFASIIFGDAMKNWGWDFIPAVLLGVGVGAIVGAFNALVILKFKVTPFIATISSMFMVRGLATAWAKGFTIYPLPPGPLEVGYATPLGVSWAFVVFLAVCLIAWVVMAYTLAGLYIRATGSDIEVASWTEVPIYKVHTGVLMTVGMLAAVAGIFVSCMLNAGTSQAGTGWEFMAITSCAIGGVSLFGYEGSIFGLFCGCAVMQVLQNGIILLGVSAYLQVVLIGAVLLIAITLDVKRRTYLNLEKI